MENRKLTLRELKAMLPTTNGKPLPTPKYLRENDTVAVKAATSDSSVTVYQSGFAVYRTPRRYAVIRMEHVGQAAYQSEQDDWASTVNVEDEDWTIGVMLRGEERMEKKYEERAAERLVSMTGGGEDGDGSDMELDAGVDVLAEVVSRDQRARMLNCLTDRQRQVVEMFYFEGLLQSEIAKQLDISIPVVCKRIKAAERSIKKNFKNFSQGG